MSQNMFPGYQSTSRGGQIKEEPSTSDDRGNARQFTSYGRSEVQERIMEERRKKDEKRRRDRRFEKEKERRTYRSYKPEDSDESSDDAPTVPLKEEAFTEHLNGVISRRRQLDKKGNGNRSDSDDKQRKRKRADKKDKKSKRGRSSSSDSGERRKKAKKNKRNRSSSSESEIEQKPVVNSRPKYSFMVDGAHISHNLFQDNHPDYQNGHYDSVYAGHRSSFFTSFSLLKISGQPRLLDILFNTSKDKTKATEEKSERSLLSEKPLKFSEKKREHLFRRVDFPHSCDFMPLSNHRFEEFRFLHEIQSEREQRHDEMEMASMPRSALQQIQERLKEVKYDLNRDPRRAKLYHEFLDLEDSLFKCMVEVGDLTDAQGNQAHKERKLDIVQKAIANCPGDVGLKVKKIKLLVEEGRAEDVVKEWKMLLNIFPNQCELWRQYLDHIQNSASNYTHNQLEQAFNLCDEKLTGILAGTIRSHDAERGTGEFQFNCFIRRLKWLLSCGFTERVIASVQATLDLSCVDNKCEKGEFVRFWESNAPRFGDVGGRGLIDCKMVNEEIRVEQIKKERAEFEKFKDQRGAAQYRCQTNTFADYEREISELYVRPGRYFFDEEVEYTKIDHCELFMCNLNSPAFKRMSRLFTIFGATIYSSDYIGENEPGFHLAMDFGVEPPYQDFPVSCLERVLLMMENCYALWGDSATTFIYSMIPTQARIFAANKRMSDEEKFKEMNGLYSYADKFNFFEEESRKLVFVYFGLVEMVQFASTPSLKNKWFKKADQLLKISGEQLYTREGLCTPLVLQIHLGLLVKVAQNKNDVDIGAFITRWVLRLDQDEMVSPNQLLAAKAQLREMCSAPIPETNDISQFSSSLLEHHGIYCRVLIMYLEYSAKSPGSCNWIESVEREILDTNGRKSWLLNLVFLDLLLKQRKNGNAQRHAVIEHAIQCVKQFPMNKSIWKKFCDVGLACHFLSNDRLKLTNLEISGGEFAQNMYCLTKMKWELCSGRRRKKEENDRAYKLAIERAESSSDPFWWRMALKYGPKLSHQDLYVRAASNCRWSKQLHLDMFDTMKDATEMQILESGVRMVTSTDEYNTLRSVGDHPRIL